MVEYIERDEAIRKAQDACIKIVFRVLGRGITQFDAADIVDVMESIPVADVAEVKRGYWIPSRNGINPIRCSVCNTPAPMAAGNNEFGGFEIRRYPSSYCHECGAKMDGKDGAE